MLVKTDTKEKFYVITVQESSLSADMSAELTDLLLGYLQKDAGSSGSKMNNIILNLEELQNLDEETAENLVKIQQKFYESKASFVICGLQKPVEEFLDSLSLLELMNTTPTISEAGDIIMMEEIEREFLDEE